METQGNRNKTVQCNVCSKSIRSDNLKRHTRTHKDILSMTDEEVREELRERHAENVYREERRKKILEIAREENIPSYGCNEVTLSSCATVNKISLREEMNHNNQEYLDKIELGEQIAKFITEDNIREESLSKEHKEALKFYKNQMPRINIQDVELRPWQQQLLDIIKTPSEREVIWVKGLKGNEGKTWFQKYMQALFGSVRVARLDIKSKTANILHALRKFPLSTTDIFLFNDARAINYESCCYTILEDIKDGNATASKFNSEVIQFKTPNVVIVFSNSDPDIKQLSKDRWKIYHINKNGLKSYEERLWELVHTKRVCHSDFGRTEYNDDDYE